MRSTGAPAGKPSPEETFRGAVLKALDASQWITDGNYHSVRDLVWDRADCVVWPNYRLPLILTRLVRRTATRIVSGQRCCNGNRESLQLLLSRESIILWALKTHDRRSREYPPLLRRVAEQGKSVVIHGSPKETRAWVDQIRRAQSEAQS